MEGIEASLRSEFPNATKAEVKRFVRSCFGNGKVHPREVKRAAEEALKEYLDWRNCYNLDHKDSAPSRSDAEDWRLAVEKSIDILNSMHPANEKEERLAEKLVNYEVDVSDSQFSAGKAMDNNSKQLNNGQVDEIHAAAAPTQHGDAKDGDNCRKKNLEQVIFQHSDDQGNPLTDKKGYKILHVLPGLIDRQVAQADFYALVLGLYLDRKFDRESEETMTVVIDVRAGEGWPNPVAFMMVKFVQTITKELQSRYPGRLRSLLVFPVPWAAMGVWTAIKRVFRLDITDKIMLVSGPADRAAPLPRDQLGKRVDLASLEIMENFRLGQ